MISPSTFPRGPAPMLSGACPPRRWRSATARAHAACKDSSTPVHAGPSPSPRKSGSALLIDAGSAHRRPREISSGQARADTVAFASAVWAFCSRIATPTQIAARNA